MAFVIGWGSANGWYHAGSFIHISGDRWIAARFVLYFFATLIILMLLSPIRSAHGPHVGGSRTA